MKRVKNADVSDENISSEIEPPLAKKAKVNGVVDGIPAEVIQAQKQFVEDAKNFAKTGEGVDVVKEYLEKNSGCNDILLLLYQGASHSEAAAIFNSLEVILLRITEDLSNYISEAIDVIHRLLENFSRLIMRNFNFTNTSTEIKSALKLLSAMATVSRETANDVFNVIDFSRRADLLKRINSKDPQDVRACFINLMLAFLMSDSSVLITKVIKLPEFAVIFQDLHGDKQIVIEVFLNTVTTKVLYNTAISKTAKISLFGESTLKHVVKLLTWEGPRKFVRKKKSTAIVIDAKTDEPDKDLDDNCVAVRSLALKFLLVVCSHKHGILFKDETIGTSEKNRNPVISAVLHNFQYDTVGNALKEEFVVRVLKACPDQLVTYLYLLEHSILPKPTAKWTKLLNFINKVYDDQDHHQIFTIISKSPAVIPMKSAISMVMNLLLPPLKISQTLVTALQHSHIVVKRKGLSYVLKTLKRLERVLLPCEECLVGKNNCLTPVQAEEFIRDFKLQLVKILPTYESLISIWEYFMRYNDKVVKDGIGDKNSFPNTIEDHISDADCRSVLGEDLLLVLDMCAMIGKFMPSSAMDQLVYCIKKMLSSIDNCQSWVDVSEKCLVQLRFLRLMNDMNFWKSGVIEKGNTGLELFVEILTNCSAPHENETIQIMKSFLLASPVLHGNVEEVTIWMSYLERSTHKVVLAKFLDASFTGIFNSERTVEIVKNGEVQHVSKKTTDGNKMQLLEDMISYCNIEKTESPRSSSRDSSDCNFLSPLMISALQKLDDSSEKCVLKYLANVLMAVLHQQTSPQVMLDFLSRIFMNVLPRAFKKYMRCITSSEEDSLKFKPHKCKDICGMLEYTFACRFQISDCKYDVDTVSDMMEKMIVSGDTFQVQLVAKQLLFYIQYILVSNEIKDVPLAVDAVVYYCSVFRVLITIIGTNEASESAIKNELFKNLTSILFRHPIVDMCFSLDVCNNEDSPFRTAIQEVSHLVVDAAEMFHNSFGDILKSTTLGDRVIAFVNGALKVGDDFVETFSLSRIASNFLRDRPVKALVKLVKRVLIATKSAEDSPRGALARLMASLLEILMENSEASCVPVLKEKLIQKCFKLLWTVTESNSSTKDISPLQKVLLKLIRTFPFYSTSASDEVFHSCLRNNPSVVEQHIASTLITTNQHFHEMFESWCVKKKIDVNFQDYVHAVSAYLHMLAVDADSRRADVTSKVLKRLFKIYWKKSCELVFADQDVVICKLLSLFCCLNCVDDDAKEHFIDKFKLHTKNSPTETKKQLIRLVYKILAVDDDGKCTFVFLTLKLLTSLLKMKEDDVASNNYSGVISLIVHNVLEVLPRLKRLAAFEGSAKKFNWMKFVKNSLKFALSIDSPPCSEGVLRLLTSMLKFLSEYGFSNELVDSADVHYLIVSHSRFIPVMLEANNSELFHEKKCALLDLITFLVQKSPSVCRSSHVCIFLGAYGATLSPIDQKLLRLLCIYEQCGIDMYNFRPFLWGEAAVNRYVSTKTASLWKQPSADEVLNLLDSSNVLITASKFPVHLPLEPNVQLDCEVVKCSDASLYDPRFLIPLLNHLFSPESYVPFKVCLSSNILTLIFGALKSCDADMRVAAYHIVRNLYEHLEGSKYILRLQILHILDCLKNGISKPNAQISSVVSAFLINLMVSLTKPNCHLTKKILAYMHQRPVLKLFEVPNLNGFFFSDDVKQYESRKWILDVMASGLNTKSDFKIFQNNDIIQILLTFCSSTLSDTASKIQVLGIIEAAIQIPGVAMHLCNYHCLVSFLQGLIQQDIHIAILPELVNVVHKLWLSLVEDWSKNEQPAMLGAKSNGDVQGLPSDDTATVHWKSPYMISKQFSVLLMSMINQNSLAMDCSTLRNYLSNLVSTLNFTQKYCANQQVNFTYQLTSSHIKRLLQLYEDSLRSIRTSSVEGQQIKEGELEECVKDLIDIFLRWNPSISYEKCNIDERATIFGAVLKFSLSTVPDSDGTHVRTVLKVLNWVSGNLDFIQSLPESGEIATALFAAILGIFKPSIDSGDEMTGEQNFKHYLEAKAIFSKMMDLTTLTGNSAVCKTLRSWIRRCAE